MNPVLTIIIPTYQNPWQLKDCISTLLLCTEFPYKIVIVNNDASPHGRITIDQMFQSLTFKDFEVIHMESNKGWMGGINAGMEKVDTPYVCMMNDDVVFIPGQKEFWRQLIMDFNDNVAAVGPCSNFVMGDQSLFMYEQPPIFPSKFLIGYCMVLDTEKFRHVGLLDETLPGGDDLDLSIRFRKEGWDLMVDRTCYLHHIGCQTGAKVHEGYWNSLEQTDRTNNALIRKHGVKWWYDTISGEKPKTQRGWGYEELLAKENDWLTANVPTDGKVLDIGSGDNKWGTIGLDRSKPGGTGAGGRKFTGATPDLSGDALDIPLKNDSVDHIVACHIFEHLVDPIAGLDEWKRVMKQGGTLIVTCPNHDKVASMLIDYTHVHAYTLESLKSMLKLNGFDVLTEEIFPNGSLGMKCRLI